AEGDEAEEDSLSLGPLRTLAALRALAYYGAAQHAVESQQPLADKDRHARSVDPAESVPQVHSPPGIEPDEHMAAHDGRFLAGAQAGAWEFLPVAHGGGVEEKDRDGEDEPSASSAQKGSPGS